MPPEFASPRSRPSLAWPSVCVVGPLPPPSGGMANQCEQLLRLLAGEGAQVLLVRTNAQYRPAWVAGVPMLRAGARLLPYLLDLWRTVARCDVVHVFANSGWAWHLLAAPALLIARWRGVPAIVHYHGGLAEAFLARAPGHVLGSLRRAALCVTPSAFLQRVFARHGLAAKVVPNIVDLSRFHPRPCGMRTEAPHLIVTRNLEPVYDIGTALRAFAIVRRRWPQARLTVAGSGPQGPELQALAAELGVTDAVVFPGRIDNADIGALYRSADCMLNPSAADNMPISILEALASGVPVVSTDAGGIPDLVEDGVSARLVAVGQPEAMARAAIELLEEPARVAALCEAGARVARRFDWDQVRQQWHAAYTQVARSG